MKRYELSEAVGMIDDRFITEAAEFLPQKKSIVIRRFGVATVAACLAVVLLTAVIVTGLNKVKSDEPADVPGSQAEASGRRFQPRPYNQAIAFSETAVIWSWEYMTENEKCQSAELNGIRYTCMSGDPLEDVSEIGESLGKCTVIGVDMTVDKEYRSEREAFAVKGADTGLVIAVKLGSGYFIYRTLPESFPETLGDVFDPYGLESRQVFSRFESYEGYTKLFEYTAGNGQELVRMIAQCRSCKTLDITSAGNEYITDLKGIESVVFTVNCPELGICNKALRITKNGYIITNIFEAGYAFDIGTEMADKIITAALEQASKADPNEGDLVIGGRVTEIGEGYIKVDDTELCTQRDKGMVFKVLTGDLRIRRYIEYAVKPKIGDMVVVRYRGDIDPDGTVSDVLRIARAEFSNGLLNVPE